MRNSNETSFSFISHVCYFSYHPSIAASEARSSITLFSTKMRGRKHSRKNINIPVFQICSRNNKTSLLLYAWEVIYLINKGVISLYVQVQGEMLLKFDILHFHYVTHYWARIECHPFQSSPEVLKEAHFVQYGKIILKPLKNCFLWFGQVAVFTVISWNHYTEIFMNFGAKRL